MHKTTPQFWSRLELLPSAVQQLARKNFELLKDNPAHPSLHFKKVGRFRSVRIGLSHRALAVEDGADFIRVWIGKHDDYDRLIS